MDLHKNLLQKKEKLAVIGLGYVGLPLALAFAKKVSVIGYDINESRIAQMQQGIDPSKELGEEAFQSADITFTSNAAHLTEASFFIITVPTPIDEHNVPDLSILLSATKTVGAVLKKGDYVVFESTVYPGCTEEDCLPILEKESGLKAGIDFKYGYSPERINPGDAAHGLQNVVKIVSGCDEEATETIAQVYELVVQAGVFKATSVKVAEAAKIIENTQRDINIAFMNELSIIFDKMGIPTHEVLAAAATKWNFQKFYPGLVGGHCIGVNPYYLTYKAAELGYISQVIISGRSVNDSMAAYISKKIVQHVIEHSTSVKESKVLMMGITFKENVSDVRNSKVADIVNDLKSYSIQVDITDPFAESDQVEQEYGFSLIEQHASDYDAVVIAVPHRQYQLLDDSYFASITKPTAFIIDIKGMYRDTIQNRKYWCL